MFGIQPYEPHCEACQRPCRPYWADESVDEHPLRVWVSDCCHGHVVGSMDALLASLFERPQCTSCLEWCELRLPEGVKPADGDDQWLYSTVLSDCCGATVTEHVEREEPFTLEHEDADI